MHIFQKGETVFIISDKAEVIEAIIESQEWWNKSCPNDNQNYQVDKDGNYVPYPGELNWHPIYYNLLDKEGNYIPKACTGNWHFEDVFSSRKEAQEYLTLMKSHGWYEEKNSR